MHGLISFKTEFFIPYYFARHRVIYTPSPDLYKYTIGIQSNVTHTAMFEIAHFLVSAPNPKANYHDQNYVLHKTYVPS